MRRIVPCVVLAMVVAVPAYLVGQQSVSPEYQKVMDAFTAAYNKADAAGIGAIYAEDGLRVAPDGAVLSGRAAIQQSYGGMLSGPMKGASIKLTATESRQLTPDIHIVVGTWEITGGQAGPASGTYINTLVRKDGSGGLPGTWRCASRRRHRPRSRTRFESSGPSVTDRVSLSAPASRAR
jgi:uncharacterized protein (TIGR02246 family)